MTKRLLLGSSAILLFLPLAMPHAQEAKPYFRLETLTGTSIGEAVDPGDTGGGTETPEEPDGPGDIDDSFVDPSTVMFSYPARTGPVGTPITLTPNTLSSDYYIGEYYLENDLEDYPPEWNLSFDSATGAVTMTPQHGGVHRITVVANALRQSDGVVIGAKGYADVNATADYAITVDSSSFTFQNGTVGANRTFTASTNPPQPTAGETWTLERSSDLPSTIANNGPVATFDFDTEMAATSYMPDGQHWFQFVRTDNNGVKVASQPIYLNINRPPAFRYAPDGVDSLSGPGYAISNFGGTITIRPNVAVSIDAIPTYGAATAIDREDAPLWMQAPDIDLPAGLSFAADGDIVGTATQLVGPGDNLWVPIYAMTSSNPPAYGSSAFQIVVAEASPYDDADGNGILDGLEAAGNDLDRDGIPNSSDPDKDGDGIPDSEELSPQQVYTPDAPTYWWDASNVEMTGGDGFLPANGPYATLQESRDAVGSAFVDCMNPYLYTRYFNGFVEDGTHLAISWDVYGPGNTC